MTFFKLILSCLLVVYVSTLPCAARHCPVNLRGLIAPVFTPLKDNGALDLSVIPGYARYLLDNDVDGICIATYTGEGPKLSVAETKRLISAWLDAVGYLNLFSVSAVIGGRPFADVIELARYAESQGLDAIFTLPDLFYKPQTVEDLVYANQEIADAAPNTPLFYYDVPRFTDVNVDIAEFFTLASQRIPTFKGLSIDNCDDGLKILPILQDDQVLFITNSSYLAPAVYLGIENFCLTEINIFPNRIRAIVDSGSQGKLNETNELFIELLKISNAILSVGEEIPAFKAAMTYDTNIDVGPPRNPQQALDEDQQDDLEQQLDDLLSEDEDESD